MTRSELFSILRPIIMTVTGVPECILANQSETAPTGDYCSVEPFSSLSPLGRGVVSSAEVDAVDGNVNFMDQKETLASFFEAAVSVNFYRGAAQDYANLLSFCDQRSDISDTLYVNGVGWMGVGSSNNLTSLNSGQYEPRSQVEIRVRIRMEQEATVQQIYVVPIEGQDQFGNVISQDEIDVGS